MRIGKYILAVSLLVSAVIAFPLRHLDAAVAFSSGALKSTTVVAASGNMTIIGWLDDTASLVTGTRTIMGQDTGSAITAPARRLSSGNVSGRVLSIFTEDSAGNPCLNYTSGVFSQNAWHAFISTFPGTGTGQSWVISATGTIEATGSGTGACTTDTPTCTAIGSDGASANGCGTVTGQWVGGLTNVMLFNSVLTYKQAYQILFSAHPNSAPNMPPIMWAPLTISTDLRDLAVPNRLLTIISGSLNFIKGSQVQPFNF